MRRVVTLLLAASTGLIISGEAQAQSAVVGEDVASRAHPEYAPKGIPVGSFDLSPSLTAGVNATDNLRAASANRMKSAYFTLRPEVSARSTWTRHELAVRAYLERALHTKLKSENYTNFGVSTTGLYDISRLTQLQVSGSAARVTESRLDLGSFRGSTAPVRFGQYAGRATLSQGFGKLTAIVGGSIERRNYSDARLGALVIKQNYRNITDMGATVDLKYALGNGLGLIGSARYNKSRYDFRPGRMGFVNGVDLDRQSSGYSVMGGVTLELSKLLFGSVRVGYLKQNYRDARLRDPSGLSVDVDLLWNPTTLTSVRLRASRSVQDTSSTVVAGNIRTDVGLTVNHELLRSLLITANGNYGHFSPNGVGVDGDEYSVGLGLRYLMNRNITVSARVDHSERDSSDPTLRYKANRGMGTVGYAF